MVRFKGFRDCIVPLAGPSVLVGANNAGKSSVISGLRLIATMIPHMRRLEPNMGGMVDGSPMRGWGLTNAAIESASFTDENVRFDFGRHETRFEARFDSGAAVALVWPDLDDEDSPGEPTCHVLAPRGFRGSYRIAAQNLLPTLGVVPTLAPLDDREQLISDDALRRNLTGRRTSRYFRNALLRTERQPLQWERLLDWLLTNTPEIDRLEVAQTRHDELDLYFREAGRRQQREATWAGDGMQIWLQALYHIWRERDSDVLVLDEPDVYLHPDLQRRLARLVFDLPSQVVLATHSTEILSEAAPGAAVWVDRSRRRADRPKQDGALTMLGRRLGSGLELGIARALRSSVALFVEGQDMRVLAKIASLVDAKALASGRDYAVIPLGGLSRYGVAGAFAEVVGALGGTVNVQVLLDRDLRCDAAVTEISDELVAQGAIVHVWQRRELENYLLTPSGVAGATGIDLSVAKTLLDAAIESCAADTLTELQTQRLEERERGLGVTKRTAVKTVLEAAKLEHDRAWRTLEGRSSIVDAKRAIHALNADLQGRKLKTVNSDKLAAHIDPTDIAVDMRAVLAQLDDAIRGN